MTTQTLADAMHRGTYAESAIEEALDALWPDLVGRIGNDPYDNSLEVYFLPTTAADLSCTQEQAATIIKLGFSRFWLNFCDGTEQYVCEHEGKVQIATRRVVPRPRGGVRESMLRSHLIARIEELERRNGVLQTPVLPL